MKKSHLNAGNFDPKSYRTVGWSGICLAVLLIIVAYLHHASVEIPDNALFYFSIIFAAIHLVIFGLKLTNKHEELT